MTIATTTTYVRRLTAFTCCAIVLFAWSTAPASARASMCDRKWLSCNSSKCTGTKCMQKCDQQYSRCRSGPFAD